MKRQYFDVVQDDVQFFIGKEVEHTPAYGQETLFITGVHSEQEIEKHLANTNITHIFFGANHSFKPTTDNIWAKWENMISYFLEQNWLCSLDVGSEYAPEFNLKFGNYRHTNFIPQIRIQIPDIRNWNYNTMIKLDDITFNKTNPGVWTHSLHELQDRSKYTAWINYKNDKIIK